MKFGYFANIHDPTKKRDFSDLVAEMREVATFLDDAGFDDQVLPRLRQRFEDEAELRAHGRAMGAALAPPL